jgi:hypothetical protein
MGKFEVAELSQRDFSLWDTLINNSSQGTIFHKVGWLDACSKSNGKKVKIFGCFQDGLLIGGCSLFTSKKLGFLPFAISHSNMTPYGGLVLSPSPSTTVHNQESFSEQIIESLIDYIKKEHFLSIRLMNSPEFRDIRPFTWNGWRSRVWYTYYLEIKGNLASYSDAKVKSTIRKAEKNGIIIETYSDISRYYDLLCETFARKNLKPPASKRLISDLYAFIRNENCGEMLVAKTPDDEIACAGIFVWDKHRAYHWSSTSNSRFLNLGAPYLLHSEFFNIIHNRGIPKINMMMANVPKLSNFASHLNPVLVPYYEIRNGLFEDTLFYRK